MADDTKKILDDIDDITNDVSRSLAKIRAEINKAADETSVWLDATKALQNSITAINSLEGKYLEIQKQLTRNVEKEAYYRNQELPALDRRKQTLQSELRISKDYIQTLQKRLKMGGLSLIEEADLMRKRQEAVIKHKSIVRERADITKKEKDINNEIIPALHYQYMVLDKQLGVTEDLVKTETKRKEIAEKMVSINDSMLKPLLGDSKEYGKLMDFGTTLMKRGASRYFAMLKASLDRWIELDKAAGEFRDKTGFLVSQTKALDKAVREVNVQMADIGVGITEAYAAAEALTKEFQVIGIVTKEMIAETAKMSANLGISVDTAAKFRGLYTSISKSAGMTSTDSMLAATALAKMAGVAPSVVLKDMAEASAETLSFLAKTPMALMKATVEARRLGTTVNSLSKSARGLLNYQDSITSELEASALIGKSLNFQEARAAAYAGDVVKSRELALKQIKKAGDFTKLNVYQQEALARAAGMTVDEIIKQKNQEEMLEAMKNSANKEDRKAYADYTDMVKKIQENEKAAQKDLVARGRKLIEERNRQTEINNLTNSLKSIWTTITDALLPIANGIMPMMIGLSRILASLFKLIGATIRGFLSPFDAIFNSFRSGNKDAANFDRLMTDINKIVEKLIPAFEIVGTILGTIYSVTTKIAMVIALLGGKAYTLAQAFAPFEKMMRDIAATIKKIGKGMGIFGKLLTPFAALFKYAGMFGKFLGPIGLIISSVQVLLDLGSQFMDIWGSDDMNIGEKIIRSLIAIPKALWNAIVQPFINGVAWILNKIWPGVGDGMLEGLSSIGKTLIDIVVIPFKIAWDWISDIFVGKSPSKLGLGIVDGIKSIGSMLIDALTWPFRTVFNFISGLFGGDGQLGTKIVDGLKSIMGTLFDVLTFPFRTAIDFVSGLFGGDGEMGTNIIEGIKSIGEFVFDALTLPFKKLVEVVSGIKSIGALVFDILTLPFKKLVEVVSGLFSGDGGSIIGSVIGGLKSAMGTLFDVLTFPIKTAVDFISGLFGGDGEMGTNIIKGIKSIGEFVFDALTLPFKKLIGFVSKIPIIGKLFGGGTVDASIDVATEAKTKAESSTTPSVEVKGIPELKESIDKLTEAILKLGGAAGAAAPIINVNNDPAAMVEKISELIDLLKDGSIGVNIDGIKASKVLARASS